MEHHQIDAALRYRAVIRRAPDVFAAPRLLEVGAGPTGLRDFVPRDLTELDLAFPPDPPRAGVTRIEGSITALPLADEAFDAVVCVDTLEHLPQDERSAALAELMRVLAPGGCLAVACPTGRMARWADARLDRSLQRRHGSGDPHIAEHIAHGLPRRRDVETALRESAPSATVEAYPHLNVVPSYLMHLYRTGRGYRVVRRLGGYRPSAVRLVAAALSRLDFAPAYRTIFVVRMPPSRLRRRR